MDNENIQISEKQLSPDAVELLSVLGRKYAQYAPDTMQKDTFKLCPGQLIRFTNHVFKKDYPLDAKVTFLDAESSTPTVLTPSGASGMLRGDLAYSLDYAVDGTKFELFFHAEFETSPGNMDVTFNNLQYSAYEMFKRAKPLPGGSVDLVAPLMWQIVFFAMEKQEVKITFKEQSFSFEVPTLQLPKLTVKDITELHLFAAGVFLPRKYRALSDGDIPKMLSEVRTIWNAITAAHESGELPTDIADRLLNTLGVQAMFQVTKSKNVSEEARTMANKQLAGINPFVMELATTIEEREKESELKGELKGAQKSIFEVVARMLKNRIPLSTVLISTDLPESDIREYASQHGLTLVEK